VITHTDTVSGDINATITHTEIDQAAYQRQQEAYRARVEARADEVEREAREIEAQQIRSTLVPPGSQISGSLRFKIKSSGKAGVLELAFGHQAYDFQISKSMAPR
jgi:hypothetical protein